MINNLISAKLYIKMASGIPATPLEHKYYWYQYDDIGFPQRVNHAAAAHVDDKSRGAYVFSFGGYHADKETRAQPDYYRNHVFKSADIDIHKFDVGKSVCVCVCMVVNT